MTGGLMGKVIYLHIAAILFFCLSLTPSAIVSGSAQYAIIDCPASILPSLKQHYKNIDVLGADFLTNRAQIRIKGESYHLISRAYEGIELIEGASFIASNLDGYQSPDKVLETLYQFQMDYPNLAESFELGLSTEGRPIRGIVLSNRNAEPTDAQIASKPSILFNGMHHARELMTTELVLDIGEYLLSNYAQDEEVKAWLDNYRIILVPQVNPDGNQKVHDGNRWWRKNTWLNRSRVTGVDLNRNYPTLWDACNGSSGNKGSQDYRGPEAASEPETRAMMALVDKFKPVLNISYHSYSEMIIYPYGCRSEANPSRQLFHEIALKMKESIIDDNGTPNTYQVGTAPELLYQADGTDLDYQWEQHNVIAYTIEINSRSTGFQPSYSEWRDITVERQRGSWKTLLRRMGQSGFTAQISPDEKISYKLRHNGLDGATNWDEGPWSKNKKPRGKTLIYELLSPGSYTLEISNDKQQKIVKTFEVGNALLDLGPLEFGQAQ